MATARKSTPVGGLQGDCSGYGPAGQRDCAKGDMDTLIALHHLADARTSRSLKPDSQQWVPVRHRVLGARKSECPDGVFGSKCSLQCRK